MPTVYADDRAIACTEGANLRDVLRAAGVPVYAEPTGLLNCHGLGTCGTCAVAVTRPDGGPSAPPDPALSPPTAVERWRLGFPPHVDGVTRGLRLACQARVRGDVRVSRRDGFWGNRPPTPPRAPRLNVDLGEYEDEPEALWALADDANVACGGHAGDAASMRRALERCVAHGTRPGAHPSYPDRAGFGRTRLDLPPEAVAAAVRGQLEELAHQAHLLGVRLAHVKPHGALYHASDDDDALADALVGAARAVLGVVTVVGPAVSARAEAGALRRAAERVGLPFARVGFADRGVDARGALLPRSAAGALLTDPAAAADRARALFAACDTLCVHADTPDALAVARAVRAALGPRAVRA
jgi:UPF0271 protein